MYADIASSWLDIAAEVYEHVYCFKRIDMWMTLFGAVVKVLDCHILVRTGVTLLHLLLD